MEHGIDAVQYEGLARGIEYEGIVVVFGGSYAIVLISVALVVEANVVGTVFGRLLEMGRVRSCV